MYDSTEEIKAHIESVQGFMIRIYENIRKRAMYHDKSKLEEPEKSMYDFYKPLLRDLPYGSKEYMMIIAKMGPGLAHHYKNNSHHPEHYKVWRCPVCDGVFRNDDAPIDGRFEGEIRLCPVCCEHGTKCTLEPASGIYGMSLLDLIEMLADWKAAGMGRMAPDELKKLGVSPQLAMIFENTIREMGWQS